MNHPIEDDLRRFTLKDLNKKDHIKDLFDDFETFLDFCNYIEMKYDRKLKTKKEDFLRDFYERNRIIRLSFLIKILNI